MADDFDPMATGPTGKADKAKKPAGTQTGQRAIRAIFADARRQLDEQGAIVDPDPHQARDGVRPGRWDGFPHDALPPGCPVHVVGRDAEGKVWLINAANMLTCVERWDMPALTGLFAPQLNYLLWAWPGWGKRKVIEDGEEKEKKFINRVERDKAMMALVNAAARRPLFDPAAQHRGRGGWKDKAERFIWHSGDQLWSVDRRGKLERSKPAEHDGFLYTRQAATVAPWAEPVAIAESPALRILRDLRSWNWERPYLDPLLVIGWIATALMGGALDQRPIIFTVGGAGVGKSTLHELVKHVLSGAVTAFADTTAAGIYQRVKTDSLPALVDELENVPGSTRAQAIIDLSRIAYTGAEMGRGGADHEAVSFSLRLSFFFSAINPPPMTDASRSRMAFLNLRRLEHVTMRAPEVKPEVDGRMLLRQVMDGWPAFREKILPSWWGTLKEQGLDSRAINTYGTLLAAAELLVGQDAMEETGLPMTEARLGEIIAEATRMERTERLDNWHRCVNHLLDSAIDAWREGVKPTIGGTMEGLASTRSYDAGGLSIEDARKRLQLVNLSAVEIDAGRRYGLAVPKDGPAVKRLFADTEFGNGGWWTALKQAPADIIDPAGKVVKVNGKATRCLVVDMVAFGDYATKAAGD